MSLLYQLLNKPWEWRRVLDEYRRRRDAKWQRDEDLARFWTYMRTCRVCLHVRHAKLDAHGICRRCWGLIKSSAPPRNAVEEIRIHRAMEILTP